MIEAKQIDTVLRGTETIGGGLFPNQIAKRKKRAKQEKRVCRGVDCITRISAYNRDKRGHLETLCYNCRSKAGEDIAAPEIHLYDAEDASRQLCANGHDLAEVGRAANGRCGECHREDERARNKAKAKAAGKTFVEHNSRVALYRLAEFMEKNKVTLNGLARKTEIPAATVRGYKRVGEPNHKGYRCPPENAEKIAEYFGVTVAVLAGEEEE